MSNADSSKSQSEKTPSRVTFLDVTGAVGVISVTIGIGLIHIPAACIAFGVMVLFYTFMAARASGD